MTMKSVLSFLGKNYTRKKIVEEPRLIQEQPPILAIPTKFSPVEDGFPDYKGKKLLPEIMIIILSFVPDSDLLTHCRNVCKCWRNFIDGHDLWKCKSIRRGLNVPDLPTNCATNFYRRLAMTNTLGRNLIQNPCGEDALRGWVLQYCGGNGWSVENHSSVGPNNFFFHYDCKGVRSCFSSSYGKCSKKQTLNLLDSFSAELLDSVQPSVYVCEWHSAHVNKGSDYSVTVELIFINDGMISKEHFRYRENQWEGQAWKKFEHLFKLNEEKQSGLRTIIFQHTSHYGSKMSNAEVRLLF